MGSFLRVGWFNKGFSVTVTVLTVLLFLVAGAIYVSAPFQALVWSKQPFPGFVVEQTLVISDWNGSNWSGREWSMDFPERVTGVGGIPVKTLADYQAALKSFSIGQSIHFDVVSPDGKTEQYPQVTLIPFSGLDLVRLFWLPYGIGLAYLILGAWVYLKRWNTLYGQAFGFFCAWTAITACTLFDTISTHRLTSLWTVGIAQLGGALIVLALYFPDAFPRIRKYPALIFLPVGISAVLSIWGLAVYNNLNQPWIYVKAWRFSFNYVAIGIVVFLGLMFYRFRRSASAEESQQIRLTLWGALLTFIPMGVWFGASFFGLNTTWKPDFLLPLMLFFPASIGLAILRYRLWDLDIIINRTLVYSLLTVLLGIIFLSLVLTTEFLLQGVIQRNGLVSVAFSTMIITILFNPLRVRVQSFIDKRFFRQKYDITRTLVEFGASLQDKVDLDQLNADVLAVIQETMQPESAMLYYCKVGQNKEEFDHIDANDSLCELLLHSHEVLDVNRLEVLSSSALRELEKRNANLVIPLVSQGDLIAVIALGARLSGQKYSVDDKRLLNMVASQVAPALRVAQLVRQYQEEAEKQERLRQELHLASLIQQSLLPKQPPELPGWKIQAQYQPARQVSGDFYDFFPLSNGRIVLIIGDVSDKGVPAALVMATTRAILRGSIRREISPGKALERTNNLLIPEMMPMMFVTCFYAILDIQNGKMKYANAGQSLPLLHRQNSVEEVYATGMPLGLMENMVYDEHEITIQPGDRILFYSDGLIEARNDREGMFGTKRLKDMLVFLPEDGKVLDHLVEAVRTYTGQDVELQDDVTLMYIERERGEWLDKTVFQNITDFSEAQVKE